MYKSNRLFNLIGRGFLGLALILVLSLLPVGIVRAEDAEIRFGSETYYPEVEGEFRVAVYLNSQVLIGAHRVEVEYDVLRLEYIDGRGVETEPGHLVITGENPILNGNYSLMFRPISGGNAYIRAASAEMYIRNNPEELFDIVNLAESTVEIPGEDTAGIEEERLAAEEAERLEEERLEEERLEAERLEAERLEAERIEAEKAEQEKKDDTGVSYNQGNRFDIFFYNPFVFAGIILIALVIMINIIAFAIIGKRRKKGGKRGQKERAGNPPKGEKSNQILDLSDGFERNRAWKETPVIRVLDVTMEFELAVENPNGLKDYVIRFLKRQIKYRTLYALNHVSFDVFKGEVVGIIGTNGSGKSTLLKIVSGALKPTGGRVKVNRNKLQILTLGTGFDGELTGKENVYLNGAIIGYSREFLDEHYDEIVKFAELEDFMEEKVKNYSSGMVSRLGFAIATVGEAAEILILDEVLSVGDEFFRKKSLKRIKEMIHGGSTVLMVSHGMGTILDNCTKCVWIEKGELRMIGEPQVVCDAYRKMGNE